jgi:hypothetical protein
LKFYDHIHQMSFDVPRAIVAATLLYCLVQFPLYGQEPSADSPQGYGELVNWAYGQDQELVNGLQYYNRHPRSLGHPYLLEGWVHQGSVRIRGKFYNNIWLKYDIYAQQLEVEYQTINGADNQVILVSDRVNDFYIGSYYFKKLKLEEELEDEQFYQIIGGGRLVWYVRWEKKLVPISGNSRFIEEFTSPKRHYLLELDGSVHPFSNKKSFVDLFPESVQKDIKKLIKSNQLQIRSASTEQLELFIMAANNILEGAKR